MLLFSRHHVSKSCAITPVPSSLCLSQARKLLRELKYQKRCKEAVTTIAAYWHGTQVLSFIWKKINHKGKLPVGQTSNFQVKIHQTPLAFANTLYSWF